MRVWPIPDFALRAHPGYFLIERERHAYMGGDEAEAGGTAARPCD
jgi:hypothetical protein